MPILSVALAIAKITTITTTAKSILELIDKILHDEKTKQENIKLIQILCEEEFKKNPQTKILTTEEQEKIKNLISEEVLDDKTALICKQILENNLIAVQMLIKKF